MDKSSSKSEKILTSLALIGIGICLVIWADKVTDWILIVSGAIALVFAFVKLIAFLNIDPKKRTNLPLFQIILSAIVGILLVTRSDFIKEAISFIVGIYMIMTCLIQLFGISTIRRKTGVFFGSLVWPVLGIIVGILCITGRFIIPDEIARLIGVALIVYAVIYLTGTIAIESYIKKTGIKSEHKKIEEAVIVKEEKSSKSSTKKEK